MLGVLNDIIAYLVLCGAYVGLMLGQERCVSFGARIQAQMNSPFLGHDDVGAMLGLLCWDYIGLCWAHWRPFGAYVELIDVGPRLVCSFWC